MRNIIGVLFNIFTNSIFDSFHNYYKIENEENKIPESYIKEKIFQISKISDELNSSFTSSGIYGVKSLSIKLNELESTINKYVILVTIENLDKSVIVNNFTVNNLDYNTFLFNLFAFVQEIKNHNQLVGLIRMNRDEKDIDETNKIKNKVLNYLTKFN
jgi:hypothetical protein